MTFTARIASWLKSGDSAFTICASIFIPVLILAMAAAAPEPYYLGLA